MMDVMMFLHLFVYPMALGGSLVSFVLVASNAKARWQVMFAVALFWVTFGLFILAVQTHINYQDYASICG
jgi:hypothetical protein